MGAHLDCVVVGYTTSPSPSSLSRRPVYKDFSGTYRHLLANTVPLKAGA